MYQLNNVLIAVRNFELNFTKKIKIISWKYKNNVVILMKMKIHFVFVGHRIKWKKLSSESIEYMRTTI